MLFTHDNPPQFKAEIHSVEGWVFELHHLSDHFGAKEGHVVVVATLGSF